MINSSEFVTSAHPDRLADSLAAYLIDAIRRQDGMNSHAAVEVFLTHNKVIFSGEVTTTLNITDEYLRDIVRVVYADSGYLPQMRKWWTIDECILAEDVEIVNELQQQSPDIALGTTSKGSDSGWNDQGVYFSSSENSNDLHLGMPMLLATMIGEYLQQLSRKSIMSGSPVILGPDIKVVVSMALKDDMYTPLSLNAITIAQSHAKCSSDTVVSFVKDNVSALVTTFCNQYKIPCVMTDADWVINGTGRFVVHGQVSDTSMTGRKISVNHPSAGPIYACKMIGGGSLVKDYSHASDFLLNVASRFISNVITSSNLSSYCVVGCAGAIGHKGLQSIFIYGNEALNEEPINASIVEFFSNSIKWTPLGINKLFSLDNSSFNFYQVVLNNFFGHPNCQPWDSPMLINAFSTKLVNFLHHNRHN